MIKFVVRRRSEVHQVLDERMHLGFEEDETKDVLG